MGDRPAFDEAKRGSAELLILALVEEEDLHGYEIGRQIELRSGGTLTFTLAALYATLYRLEARRWISGRWVEKAGQRRRRHYRITEAGRKVLAIAAGRLGPLRRGARPGGRRPLRLTEPSMTSPRPEPDWTSLVSRHAQSARIELSAQTIDELATHLEDIYLAAKADGADEPTARRHAQRALETSGLLPLRHERRPDPRAPYARLADDAAASSRSRSLAMGYALRMALRQLRLQPAFAAIVILVLGLGTGAATAVYTIVDSVVLRPLPYRAPDRLVKLWDTNTEKGLAHDPFSPVTFMDYRALPVFQDAAAWWRPDVNLRDPGVEPVRVRTIETSANLFSLLGVGPQLGEGFPKDGPFFVRSTRIAVISDRLWRTRYGADPGLIGRAARPQRLAVHDRRRHAAGIPLPGRRGRLAAAAVGPRAAQPLGALHGGRGPAEGRRRHRAGTSGSRHAGGAARPPVRRQQQGMGLRRRAAARTISSATTVRRCTCCSAPSACCSSSAA